MNPEWESGESFHADEGKRGKSEEKSSSWFLTKVLLTLTAFVLVCASVVLAIRYDRMRETLNHLEKERALQAKEIGEAGREAGRVRSARTNKTVRWSWSLPMRLL